MLAGNNISRQHKRKPFRCVVGNDFLEPEHTAGSHKFKPPHARHVSCRLVAGLGISASRSQLRGEVPSVDANHFHAYLHY